MSRAADSIRQGLTEAIEYAKGRAPRSGYRVHVPEDIDVKAIRTKLGLSQQAFAARFGFSVNTLRHWEHGAAIDGLVTRRPAPRPSRGSRRRA